MSLPKRAQRKLESANNDEKYLICYEWEKDESRDSMQWRDPHNRLSWYTLKDAIVVQRQRLTKATGQLERGVSDE